MLASVNSSIVVGISLPDWGMIGNWIETRKSKIFQNSLWPEVKNTKLES